MNVASALPSPKTAAVLVSPVLPKSAQFTNADDVHSSSALHASPINMLFSNIFNPSVPNFLVQNNQLSKTSMIRDCLAKDNRQGEARVSIEEEKNGGIQDEHLGMIRQGMIRRTFAWRETNSLVTGCRGQVFEGRRVPPAFRPT